MILASFLSSIFFSMIKGWSGRKGVFIWSYTALWNIATWQIAQALGARWPSPHDLQTHFRLPWNPNELSSAWGVILEGHIYCNIRVAFYGVPQFNAAHSMIDPR